MALNFRKRKKLFISYRIQSDLMGKLAVYWFAYHVLLWHMLFAFRYLDYRSALSAGGTAVPFRELYGTFVLEYYPILGCACLALPIVLFDLMKVTHRIAGPIYRFRQTFRALANGEHAEPVSLRPGDQMRDMQDDVNLIIEELQAHRTRGASQLELDPAIDEPSIDVPPLDVPFYDEPSATKPRREPVTHDAFAAPIDIDQLLSEIPVSQSGVDVCPADFADTETMIDALP